MKLVYSPEAHSAIRNFHPTLKSGIKLKLEALLQNPYAGKPLQLELAGFRSIAFQRYRAIYSIENREIRIHMVGHRSNVYDEFTRAIAQQNSN